MTVNKFSNRTVIWHIHKKTDSKNHFDTFERYISYQFVMHTQTRSTHTYARFKNKTTTTKTVYVLLCVRIDCFPFPHCIHPIALSELLSQMYCTRRLCIEILFILKVFFSASSVYVSFSCLVNGRTFSWIVLNLREQRKKNLFVCRILCCINSVSIVLIK